MCRGLTTTAIAVTGHYFEMASDDPARPQVWGYTDALSYAPGDEVALHLMSSEAQVPVRIARDGLHPQVVWEGIVAAGSARHTERLFCNRAVAGRNGCGLPCRRSGASGVYVVTLTVAGHQSEHMFVLRAADQRRGSSMILATGTWCAYNDWGGSNHYQGIVGPRQTDAAHEVSLLRPWARGSCAGPRGHRASRMPRLC